MISYVYTHMFQPMLNTYSFLLLCHKEYKKYLKEKTRKKIKGLFFGMYIPIYPRFYGPALS